MSKTREIINYLFDTGAFVVAPADRPFWYTSGLFGPYYINTHFLFGSKAEAEELLEIIETACRPEHRPDIATLVGTRTKRQYEENVIYRSVIDQMVSLVPDSPFAFVSGGERRDFFFSTEVARKLNLPHIYMFKDGDTRLAQNLSGQAEKVNALTGNVLHVADLITKASSYERAWLPAVASLGLTMTATLAGVDRAQGGINRLEALGVAAATLAVIDDRLFAEAEARGHIDAAQRRQLARYGADEMAFVDAFLSEHPDFLAKEAARDQKTKERVERLQALLEEKTTHA